MPTLRVMPSIFSASSSRSRVSSSVCSRSRSRGSISRAISSVMSLPGWKGISFASSSVRL
jgi:hypothetical protein